MGPDRRTARDRRGFNLETYEIANPGKVVLLATPNQGTELAETLKQSIPPIRKVFGKAVEELGTASDSLPNTLGAANFETGIIMGSRSAFPFLSPFVPGTDDGVVAIEAGKLKGMRDFIVTPTNHGSIARKKEVHRQIAFFLDHGIFDELPRKWQDPHSRSTPAFGGGLLSPTERRFRFRSRKGARTATSRRAPVRRQTILAKPMKETQTQRFTEPIQVEMEVPSLRK